MSNGKRINNFLNAQEEEEKGSQDLASSESESTEEQKTARQEAEVVSQRYPTNYIDTTKDFREALPAFTPENQSFSIWSIIKGSIGKDITKITMPIFLNEPLTMLQKTAEMMAYEHLMQSAVKEKDSLKRLAYVAAFTFSQYSSVYGRLRKPFNPIFGETYELVTPKAKFMAEQVSHHPPISAFYIEGPGYKSWGHTNVKNYFWGSSMEFKAVGLQHVILTDTNEHITI